MDKISVMDFINDNSLLEVNYIPFDTKVEIVSRILETVIEFANELNTSLVRKVSTQVFIENITNIDMKIKDDNGLDGYDQLCYHNQLDHIEKAIGNEYVEFRKILSERVSDYIRVMNSPIYALSETYKLASNNANIINTLLSQNNDADHIAEEDIS